MFALKYFARSWFLCTSSWYHLGKPMQIDAWGLVLLPFSLKISSTTATYIPTWQYMRAVQPCLHPRVRSGLRLPLGNVKFRVFISELLIFTLQTSQLHYIIRRPTPLAHKGVSCINETDSWMHHSSVKENKPYGLFKGCDKLECARYKYLSCTLITSISFSLVNLIKRCPIGVKLCKMDIFLSRT